MVSSWLSLGSVRTSPMLDCLAGSLVAECTEWGATAMRSTASAVGQLSITSHISPLVITSSTRVNHAAWWGDSFRSLTARRAFAGGSTADSCVPHRERMHGWGGASQRAAGRVDQPPRVIMIRERWSCPTQAPEGASAFIVEGVRLARPPQADRLEVKEKKSGLEIPARVGSVRRVLARRRWRAKRHLAADAYVLSPTPGDLKLRRRERYRQATSSRGALTRVRTSPERSDEPPARGTIAGRGRRESEWATFLLALGLAGDLGELGFCWSGRWARVPGGRRRPSLAVVERPRTAQRRPQLCRTRLTASTVDASRLNLNRRQSATTAGAPTDHARVCLAVPRPASATLPVPSTRAGHDGRPVTRMPDPSAWEAQVIRMCLPCCPAMVLQRRMDRCRLGPRYSPFPVAPRPIWHIRPGRLRLDADQVLRRCGHPPVARYHQPMSLP